MCDLVIKVKIVADYYSEKASTILNKEMQAPVWCPPEAPHCAIIFEASEIQYLILNICGI